MRAWKMAEIRDEERRLEAERFESGCVCDTFLWLLAGKNCPAHGQYVSGQKIYTF